MTWDYVSIKAPALHLDRYRDHTKKAVFSDFFAQVHMYTCAWPPCPMLRRFELTPSSSLYKSLKNWRVPPTPIWPLPTCYLSSTLSVCLYVPPRFSVHTCNSAVRLIGKLLNIIEDVQDLRYETMYEHQGHAYPNDPDCTLILFLCVIFFTPRAREQ